MLTFLRSKLLAIAFLILGVSGAFAQHGLKAEFYNGTNFDKLVAIKFVPNIDNYWDNQAPLPGLNPHECSIRWRGKLIPGKSGNYLFSARVDDGIRVWIDDKLIINQWELNDVGIFESAIDLNAGQTYKLKVEYFNALREGEVRLLWQIPGVEKEKSWSEFFFGVKDPYSPVPKEYLFHPDEEEERPVELAEVDAPASPAENQLSPKPEKKTKPKSTAPRTKPVVKKPEITKVEAEKFIPKNIAFEQAKTTILESSITELDIFAQFMLDHPTLSVDIEGHTDPVGDADLNLKLSKQRAYRVANYLANKGIERGRIRAEGFGGSRPLVVPEKGGYYPANRRVVFILSGFE